MQKKIGLLGGSFDPIHFGHINIAKSAYTEFQLDEVWFIPAGHSPNKDENSMTPASMRADMTALAVAQYACFRVSDIELESVGTTYTYRTLEKLTTLYPTYQFYFIMGADSLAYFEQWKHPEIICENAILLVAVRDSMNIAQIQKKIEQLKELFPAEIFTIHEVKIPISSTQLRSMARDGKLSASYLPEAVFDYIRTNHLYRSSDNVSSDPL